MEQAHLLTRHDVSHDRYRSYDELTDTLRSLQASYPELCTLSSLGKTLQGRDIWAVTLTSPVGGAAADKPGYYIDAQIHAEEHATSATALYAVWYLLSSYGASERITRLLDQQAVYVLPRINPDGAEYDLQHPYRWCGNGRYTPGADEVETGLYQHDLDGDGFIVQMRVSDPDGEWRVSDLDPRVLVQRTPGEHGGQYYRLYPEGLIQDHGGLDPVIQPPRDGNLNRNFPGNWQPEPAQYGAGAYPGSEPESLAVIRFVLDHPNICGMNAFHTHGGVILRPSSTRSDREMSARDLTLFQDLAAVGSRLTGYPVISIFEDFTPDKSKARRGSLSSWTYEELGVPMFSTELWDVETEAGLQKTAFYNLKTKTEAQQVQLLGWIDEHWGAEGFVPWHPAEHPDLGAVELGGVVEKWALRNPPPHRLEAVCHDNVLFCIEHALSSPRVYIQQVTVQAVAERTFIVRLVGANGGYLPTNLTDVALEHRVAKPVAASLCGAEILMGQASQTLGHLAGRTERKYPYSQWGQQWSPTRARAEWLVRAEEGQEIEVTVQSEKGGTVRQAVRLHSSP
ncbi:M14 family metallopeptidase [Deinococcus sp. UYEF24]